MKVAVCFAGLPRFIQQYSTNIKEHLLNHYDCDVFIHSWWDKSMVGTKIHFDYNTLFEDQDTEELFKSTYNPKKILIEPQKDFKLEGFKLQTDIAPVDEETIRFGIFNQKSQWHSIQQSYNLIENPEQYDFIIRVRPDVLLTKKIDLTTLAKDTLYIQTGTQAGWDRIYSDWFAMGSPEMMKFYCNINDKFDSYYCNGLIHMHDFMTALLRDCNIKNSAPNFGVMLDKRFLSK